MSDNLFHKTMQGNFSQSPHDHEEALSVLAENNYSIIPEICLLYTSDAADE